jgi:hypothetical protein
MAQSLRKTRPESDPYEVWQAGDWTWKVLKFYKSRENTIADPYGRVFCQVITPMTTAGGDLGDTYYREIRSAATLVSTNYGE